ncbi:zinc finger MYM-type protein 1-like [Sipha flava]|uniref:Zinc finger MYM-type protein 1-like n=1 Tax=Sipha flava TaxID=143950 RepID=A0A8B8FDZ1_9HEMI|nr:zinc finger MYM-type protein 1-like [Sipha flava]
MWKNLQQSLLGFGVDSQLQKQILSETEKWKAILKRLLDVTLFLAYRGLPFQGSSTKIGNVNNGNFLGILELLGRYDEITRGHLAYVKEYQNKGESMKGRTHYLSWMSQNEFISHCGDKILKHILEERTESIYYSIIADATPDVSHQEQNVLSLRYVFRNKETKQLEIQERFIEFLNFNEKTGESIATMLLAALDRHKIPLPDCRAQAYDNGSNMSGKIKGVQARILEKNNIAFYSPCSAHSLNLVDVNAVKINSRVKTFFGCLQSLFVSFSSSPAKRNILSEEVGVSLGSQSETRWSSRVSAIRPIVKHLPGILKSLNRVLTEINMPDKMYSEIMALKKYFSSFECIAMASFWFKVLSSINERNIIIQSRGISLEVEIDLIKDLINELNNIIDEWPTILNEASLVANNLNIIPNFPEEERRAKKRKVFHDEVQSETIIQPNKAIVAQDSFKRDVIFNSIDVIITDLTHRFEAHKNLCNLFSPILCYMKLSCEELEVNLKKMIEIYPNDLSSNMLDELFH